MLLSKTRLPCRTDMYLLVVHIMVTWLNKDITNLCPFFQHHCPILQPFVIVLSLVSALEVCFSYRSLLTSFWASSYTGMLYLLRVFLTVKGYPHMFHSGCLLGFDVIAS